MDNEHLVQAIQRLAQTPSFSATEWPGLLVGQIVEPRARTPVVYTPSICVVARGRKLVYLGEQPFEYSPENYLLVSLPLPIESEIPEASKKEPVLAAVMKFDPALVGRLLAEIEEFMDWEPDRSPNPAVAPCKMTPKVRRAFVRLLEAAADPMERRLLGPGLERELLFEVLRGPHGELLRSFVLRDGSAYRVSRVVNYLEAHYREPLDVQAIARQAGMSPSTLHTHFKRATSLSPIQFIKRMRLHDARAQLLGGRSASETAYSVGYSSASQFSREFRRMFGLPPSQVGEALARQAG
ncbi:MAG: AraC family transcriptional regulator [Myxococcota bacterium]